MRAPNDAVPNRVLPILAGLVALVAAALPAHAQPRDVAVAIGAEIASDAAGATRLTLVLSKPVEARAFAMERPDRLIVDLPEVNFQLPPEAGRQRAGVVASYRYGLFAPGRSRLVVDLTQPALVSGTESSIRGRDGAALLTIVIARADREAFRRAAAAQPATAPLALRLEPVADNRPLIVVDAGHGGTDPGALASTGVFEKDIVFAFAQSLARELESSGRYRIRMTRDHDVFVPLAERVRIARDAHADLFVSIHADSISAAPQVRGATVYTGSERATDAESAKLAERENRADAAAGVDSGDGPSEVSDILQELTLRETRAFSSRFAQRLLGRLGPVMQLSGKPHREAGFRVLRSPDVPSVLVELGYLSSKRDLDLLLSDEWRDQVTSQMGAAIDQFFAARLPEARALAAARPAAEGAAVSP